MTITKFYGSSIKKLYGKSHGQGAWWAAVHGVAKSWAQLSNFTSILILGSKESVYLTKEVEGRSHLG